MNEATSNSTPAAGRLAAWLVQALGWLPWLWLALNLLLILGATLHTGHLPAYGRPDPKEIGLWSALYYPVMLLLPLTLIAPLLWLAAGLAGRLLGLAQPYGRRQLLVYFGGWLLAAGLLFSDAAGLITWLAD